MGRVRTMLQMNSVEKHLQSKQGILCQCILQSCQHLDDQIYENLVWGFSHWLFSCSCPSETLCSHPWEMDSMGGDIVDQIPFPEDQYLLAELSGNRALLLVNVKNGRHIAYLCLLQRAWWIVVSYKLLICVLTSMLDHQHCACSYLHWALQPQSKADTESITSGSRLQKGMTIHKFGICAHQERTMRTVRIAIGLRVGLLDRGWVWDL